MLFSRTDYFKIYENANSLISSGINLASQHKNYGVAVSLLILGLEELVKYQVVINNSAEDKAFNDKTLNNVFRFHQTKHTLLQDLAVSVTKEFRHSFLQYVFKIATNQDLNENDKNVQKNGFKELGNLFGFYFEEEGFDDEEISEFISWLKKADDLKKAGFYVDYIGGQFITPKEISETEYLTTLKYVKFVQKYSKLTDELDLSQDDFLTILNSE